MRTKTMTRKANVTPKVAMDDLAEAFPGSEVISFTTSGKGGEKFYTAKLKLAEFPPSDEDKDGEEPKEPKDEPKGKGDDTDDPTGEDVLDLTEPEGDDPLADEGGEPSIGEVMDLVKAIAEKVGVPVPGADTHEEPMLDDPAGLPEPGLDGPPAPGGAPLPPPVPEKPHGPGPGVFASSHPELQKVATRRHFVVERTDAGEIGNVEMVREAHEQFPGFRVAKLDRIAKADANVAVIAMVARS